MPTAAKNGEKRPEKPKVHTTFFGRQYVDAKELVHSEAGREEIKRSNRAMRSQEEAGEEGRSEAGRDEE